MAVPVSYTALFAQQLGYGHAGTFFLIAAVCMTIVRFLGGRCIRRACKYPASLADEAWCLFTLSVLFLDRADVNLVPYDSDRVRRIASLLEMRSSIAMISGA